MNERKRLEKNEERIILGFLMHISIRYAVRDKKKRRANGGIITGIRIRLKEIEITEENANENKREKD